MSLFVPLFILAIFLSFYIPGRVVLGEQKKLSSLGIAATSIILGFVLWGWQGFIFGYLHLRFLSYVYLIIFVLFFFKRGYFKKPSFNYKKIDWIAVLIVIIGIIAQMIPYVRMGQLTSSGLFVSLHNPGDHIWHATLIQEIVTRFPPNEPAMYGVLLKNYHFWFNLVGAELIRIFNLPLFQTQFIGLYGLGSILLGAIAYSFAKGLYDSKLFIRLFLFFLYFSGDAAGWFTLVLTHKFNMNVSSLFDDATKFMDNPGRGYATLIALAGLYLLFRNRQNLIRKNIIILAILFGSLIGFKVYVGIPFLGGLFCLAFFDAFKNKFSSLWIFVISLILSLGQFLPINASSGGLFFLPVDVPRDFITQRALGLDYIAQRWSIYFEHNNYPRLIEYAVIMISVYLVVQLGLKLFGFFPLKKTREILGRELVLLYSTAISSFIVGFFFYQKVGGANIWEFFPTGTFILTIILSLNLALYLPKKNKILTVVLVTVAIVIVIPRWFYTVNLDYRMDYLAGFHGISNEELESYSFLRDKTPKDSLVFIVNQSRYVDFSSIVSALSKRNLFLSGSGVSQTYNPVQQQRKQDLKDLMVSTDSAKIIDILKKNDINYVYFYGEPHWLVSAEKLPIEKVFSNRSSVIFKVK